ncbi:aldose epimerase [Bacillus cereus]|nr:aldose epimerase [Bacillus cereus]MCX2700873.1 aldose epimerase [Bacillus sp. AS_5]MDM5038610.1 aldose epimerase [Bacillus sp. OR-18]MCC2360132.1 aldose epimerase [Bacillus cereus]MDA2578660.1 aldose epimerase [Bacillus cereus]MDK7478002.1 aldose epimerase [Bacillus cereus]
MRTNIIACLAFFFCETPKARLSLVTSGGGFWSFFIA